MVKDLPDGLVFGNKTITFVHENVVWWSVDREQIVGIEVVRDIKFENEEQNTEQIIDKLDIYVSPEKTFNVIAPREVIKDMALHLVAALDGTLEEGDLEQSENLEEVD